MTETCQRVTTHNPTNNSTWWGCFRICHLLNDNFHWSIKLTVGGQGPPPVWGHPVAVWQRVASLRDQCRVPVFHSRFLYCRQGWGSGNRTHNKIHLHLQIYPKPDCIAQFCTRLDSNLQLKAPQNGVIHVTPISEGLGKVVCQCTYSTAQLSSSWLCHTHPPSLPFG